MYAVFWCSSIHFLQAAEHPSQRGFARAVGANKAGDLACGKHNTGYI